MSQQHYSSGNTVKTVAGREITVLLKSKGIVISILLTLVVTVGGVFAASFFMGKEDSKPTLVVAGMDTGAIDAVNKSLNAEYSSQDSPLPAGMGAPSTIEVEKADSADAAKQAVQDGKDAALIATGEGKDTSYELVSDGTADTSIIAVVSAALSAQAQNEALGAVGVNPQEFADAMPTTNFTQVDLSQEDPSEANIGAVITVMIGVGLMSFFIMLFAGNIGSRVTEEKSSRVIEIILASVRPLDFLSGKLVANVLMGFVSTLLILGSGALAIYATGLLDDFNMDYTVIPLMLLAFVIGLLFFGSLYAAAGSLVSRTEDLQSTQTPIMLFVFGMIYAPFFGWSALDSTAMEALSWIPPFSLTVAPLLMAGGVMNVWMVLVSYAVAIVVTVLVMMLVARIYRNAILHNGSKLTWRKALKGS